MSASDAERATSELDVGLRLAGVGRLFDYLASNRVGIEPSAWCPGRWRERGVIVAADIRSVTLLCDAGVDADPDVRTIDVRAISRVTVHASMNGFSLDVPDGSVVVSDAPRAPLATLVAYLITHHPSPRHRPGLSLPGGTP